MKKLVVLGVTAVAAGSIGLLSAGTASSDPVNPNQMNVIGEPYYKAVKILHGIGMQTGFGGGVGSALPQAQCMVTSQKMVGQGKMMLNLDCTKEAAEQMAEAGHLEFRRGSRRRRRQHVAARAGPDRPRCGRTRRACTDARRLALRQLPQVLQRLRHGPRDLTRRHPIGDHAEQATRAPHRPSGRPHWSDRLGNRAGGTGRAALSR